MLRGCHAPRWVHYVVARPPSLNMQQSRRQEYRTREHFKLHTKLVLLRPQDSVLSSGSQAYIRQLHSVNSSDASFIEQRTSRLTNQLYSNDNQDPLADLRLPDTVRAQRLDVRTQPWRTVPIGTVDLSCDSIAGSRESPGHCLSVLRLAHPAPGPGLILISVNHGCRLCQKCFSPNFKPFLLSLMGIIIAKRRAGKKKQVAT